MDLYVVQYHMMDSKVIYYTTDIKFSQDTLLGTYDLKLANFYKKAGTAKNVMKKEINTTKCYKAKPEDMSKYAVERRNILSISVEKLDIKVGKTIAFETI